MSRQAIGSMDSSTTSGLGGAKPGVLDRTGALWLGLALLGLWEAACRLGGASPLVLPAPTVIAQTLWQGLLSGYWWPHIGQTLMSMTLGWLLGAGAGFGAGVALAGSARLRRWMTPWLVISQVTPKLALGPLFVLWFGFGTVPTVLMTALICCFPLLENTLSALAQTDAHQLQLFRALRASRRQTLWRLQIPAGRHTLWAGLRVALVLAWVGAVVSEFIGTTRGLGAVIVGAQGAMDTSLLFAALVWLAVLGVASYALLGWTERRLSPPSLPA